MVSWWQACIKAWTLPATTNAQAVKSFMNIPSAWNPALRVLVFLVCLAPFALLVTGVVSNSLGPDPADHLMHVTGEWVMRFLVLVLLATPLARHGWPRLARYRRMLGLYVWFYATLHLLVFAQVFIGWSGVLLIDELVDRPYVLVGFLAWLILVPLGITSARAIRKKMGKHWRQLHKLTYAVVVLGWLHLFWLSRSDVGNAALYGGIFGILLLYRIRPVASRVPFKLHS